MGMHRHGVTLVDACLLVLVVAVFAGASGCASAEREMIPVDRVVNYTETADYARPATWQGRTLGPKSPYAARCRKYREDIDTYRTAYVASLGVGAAGVILGLLSDDETVHGIAGAVAAASSIAQAGTATAAQVTANEAREWGCEL